MQCQDEAHRATAYLRDYILETLERLHDGSINQAQAALLMWKEVDDIFRRASRAPYQAVGRLRVEIPEGKDAMGVLEAVESLSPIARVATAKLLPPPDPPTELSPAEVDRLRKQGLLPSVQVLYLSIEAETATMVARFVKRLEHAGFKVGRYSYGY